MKELSIKQCGNIPEATTYVIINDAYQISKDYREIWKC